MKQGKNLEEEKEGIQDASPKEKQHQLLQAVIDAIIDKKGQNVVSIDLRKVDGTVADYFILCDASNPVQMRVIADNVEKEAFLTCNEKPYGRQIGEEWSLIDFVDLVVHIFKGEERLFYDLEGLWEDGFRKEYAS